MSGAWLARLRWRRRGAWLWPAFAALTVIDAAIAHALPPAGDSQSFAGALLVVSFLNLLAVLLLSRPLGNLLRRHRPEVPDVVARDYGGRAALAAIAAAVLATGLLHHSTVVAHRHAMDEAIVRAQAWIGARAPAQFRRNVEFVNTFTIEPGHIYRTCVPDDQRVRTFCVIVDVKRPFAQSVSFAGYEPNSVFSEGVG